MTDIEVLHSRIAKLEAIIATHDLCHDLHGKVDARAFADGCAQEQRKLYGCAPDADALTSLKEQQKQKKKEILDYLYNQLYPYVDIFQKRTLDSIIQLIKQL